MSTPVSVTEVRNALRCPRIFVLGRRRGAPLGFPVGSSCLGGAFHRIVERFAGAIDAPPPALRALGSDASSDATELALRRWLMALLVDELVGDPAYASMPAEVDDLAEALRQFGGYVTRRLDEFPGNPAERLASLVHGGERTVEDTLGTGTLIRGRIDALYARASGALDVVEYKLTDEANDTLDRAQVALYRALLRGRDGLDARPVVLRFTPALREVVTEPQEADALVTRVVLPLVSDMGRWLERPETAPGTSRRDLCAACALVRECVEAYPEALGVRDEPPTAAARPRPRGDGGLTRPEPVTARPPADADEDGRREAARIQERIIAELAQQGVGVVPAREPIVGPTLLLIEVTRQRGSVRDLDRAAEDVKHRLAAADGLEVIYENVHGKRTFTVRRRPPRPVLLQPLLEAKEAWLRERSGRFIVGQEPAGGIVCGDFSESSTPHLLVGGQAGSGKSVLLRALVASMVQYQSPAEVRFTLVDPKRVTFHAADFATGIAAHLDGPILYDAEEALPVLEGLVDIMTDRYRQFEDREVSDLAEYNDRSAPADRIERRVVVVDEFQDLTADKAAARPFFDAVKRLGAKARAAGIHLILATQRPDKDTVPPIIKANLGGKIALRVANATNSRVILDAKGAEKLLGKGDLLADLGHGAVRAQAPLV